MYNFIDTDLPCAIILYTKQRPLRAVYKTSPLAGSIGTALAEMQVLFCVIKKAAPVLAHQSGRHSEEYHGFSTNLLHGTISGALTQM